MKTIEGNVQYLDVCKCCIYGDDEGRCQAEEPRCCAKGIKAWMEENLED